MRKTNRVQQQSMGLLWVRSLGAAQRLVVCIEKISYALLSRRIQSAVAICSIAWLASLWLAAALAQYHLFHAARAQMLRELGRAAEAAQEDWAASRLTSNPAELQLLQRRIESAGGAG